uniref:Reverse transcriptase domain-containing protein n=1 Tax=Tanacetum cinerariifolium TaxID=118510 RepID=A0A6L2JD33_TANCI|nr:hypothetical protein [Tanacetum cinerariifolium]
MSEEILQAKENLMKSIQTFLKNINRISFRKMPKNLVPIPTESEVTSKNESECDVPVNDESSPIFTTLSNPLFDCNDDFTSSDDKSLSNEDVPMENFKIYSNLLFDNEESISPKIDPHYFNAKSDLIESIFNQDTLIDSSPKFDYLLELTPIDQIPLRIKEADFDLEEEILPVENLLYDNSSPRPLEELNVEIAITIVEFLSTSPILVEDNDSQIEEIDLFLATNDLMPLALRVTIMTRKGISIFLKNLLVLIDLEPDTGVLTAKIMEAISEHHVPMPKVLPFQPTLCLILDPLLSFSSKNKDKVFKTGILSYLLISHQDKIISEFYENPMVMYGGNIPHLDVPFLYLYPS